MIYSLTGIKHVGKTTLLHQLKPYAICFDLDAQIIAQHTSIVEGPCNSVREIYRSLGNRAFRRAEYTILHNLLQQVRSDTAIKPVCIATGGGLAEQIKSMRLLYASSIVVHMTLDCGTVWQRIQANGKPAFLRKNVEKTFQRLYKKRRRVYERFAHHTLDATLTIEEQRVALLQIMT